MVKKSDDVVVVGAGAAGLTAAYFAAKQGCSVVVLERTDKAGKKILVSGGTRCNVLPVKMELSDYVTDSSPNVMKRIFKSWSLEACHRWLSDEIGLALVTEEHSNKWFPASNSAKEVRDKLLDAAEHAGAVIRYNAGVKALHPHENGWEITLEDGEKVIAGKVIMATGGLSMPTMGTDGLGHRVMKKAGHALHPMYAALTPLKGTHPAGHELPGLSLDVAIEVHGNGAEKAVANRTGFLFTHSGFSGPAILDVSHWAVKALERKTDQPEIRVNWAMKSGSEWNQHLTQGKGTVLQKVKEWVPQRLAEALCSEVGLGTELSAELSKEKRQQLMRVLTAYSLPYDGHEGYRKAEVTGGGIPLEEVDTATLQSKHLAGVYICGELLDVFGRIGGFNFYWAWLTGRLAGISVAKQMK